MASLLRVENLDISYATSQGSVPAVRHASFSIGEGEVVGESGSGKSTLALSLARMLPANARCESGTIIFRGKNLLRLSEKQLTTIRGRGDCHHLAGPGAGAQPLRLRTALQGAHEGMCRFASSP